MSRLSPGARLRRRLRRGSVLKSARGVSRIGRAFPMDHGTQMGTGYGVGADWDLAAYNEGSSWSGLNRRQHRHPGRLPEAGVCWIAGLRALSLSRPYRSSPSGRPRLQRRSRVPSLIPAQKR